MKNEIDETLDKVKSKVKKIVTFSIIGLLLCVIIFGSAYTIKAGERGVLLTFGKADMVAKEEGLHFKVPFVQKIVKMTVQTQKYESDITAASKDLQDISTKIAINFHLKDNLVPEIYTNLGVRYAENVIYPLEQEVNKAITSQFTAEELITKREIVKENMKQVLTDKLESRGIVVEEVSIVNFAFSEQFNNAIENKVVQEQLKLQKGIELERARIEAQTTIVKATAEAESLKLQKQQITPELIELRKIENNRLAIEKWNSILPTVMCGSGNPFVNVGDFITK